MKPLDEIEARLKKATPGPWVVDIETGFTSVHTEQRKDNIASTGPTRGWSLGKLTCGRNTEFIAHSPTDIARLCKAVRYLMPHHKCIPDAPKRLCHACEAEAILKGKE